jgi:site-specific recombinase XerD
MVELEVIQTNPAREICIKHKVQVIRTTLSQSERQLINYHLKTHHYRFWLFTHIFFHSGARISELMQVRRSEVDLGS